MNPTQYKHSVEQKIINNQKLTDNELADCAFGTIGECVGFETLHEVDEQGRERHQTAFIIDNVLYAIDWYNDARTGAFKYGYPFKADKTKKALTKIFDIYYPIEED